MLVSPALVQRWLAAGGCGPEEEATALSSILE